MNQLYLGSHHVIIVKSLETCMNQYSDRKGERRMVCVPDVAFRVANCSRLPGW